MIQSLFLKTSICTYFVITMCALFSQKKFPHFLQKKMYFLRKQDFSSKLEGGIGLQGVSSNLYVHSTLYTAHSVEGTVCTLLYRVHCTQYTVYSGQWQPYPSHPVRRCQVVQGLGERKWGNWVQTEEMLNWFGWRKKKEHKVFTVPSPVCPGLGATEVNINKIQY